MMWGYSLIVVSLRNKLSVKTVFFLCILEFVNSLLLSIVFQREKLKYNAFNHGYLFNAFL